MADIAVAAVFVYKPSSVQTGGNTTFRLCSLVDKINTTSTKIVAEEGSALFTAGSANLPVTFKPTLIGYQVSGVVTEGGSPVARLVRIYRRDNGVKLGEATSSAVNGSWALPIVGYNGEVFAVAFDDNLNVSYNAQIADRIIPT